MINRGQTARTLQKSISDGKWMICDTLSVLDWNKELTTECKTRACPTMESTMPRASPKILALIANKA